MPGLEGLGNCILYSYLFTDYFLKNEVVGKRFVELIKGVFSDDLTLFKINVIKYLLYF